MDAMLELEISLKSPRREYLQTTEYKVAFILFKYCRLANLSAQYVMEKIAKPVVAPNGRYEAPIPSNYAILAEGGFNQLSMQDNAVLCKYVAEAYRYDYNTFWNAVKNEAMCIEVKDRTTEDARTAAMAIAHITNALE